MHDNDIAPVEQFCGDASEHEAHDGALVRANGLPGGLDMQPIHCPGYQPGVVAEHDEPAVPIEDALRESAERTAQRKLARELADGLRAAAALVEELPELALSLQYSVRPLHIPVMHRDNPVHLLAAAARASLARGGTVSKSYDDKYGNVDVAFGPVQLQVYVNREQVCERVVTGVTKVTETVPDPALLAEVPLVEVTKEVEQVEWRCRPLLAVDTPEPAPAGAR